MLVVTGLGVVKVDGGRARRDGHEDVELVVPAYVRIGDHMVCGDKTTGTVENFGMVEEIHHGID